MALRSKLITTAALSLAIGTFSVVSSAQTTTETAPEVGKAKAEKHERGFGKRGKFGKRGGHGRMGRRGGYARMGFMRGIELTDAQKAQIKQIREANKPSGESSDLMKSIRETRKAGGTITEDQKAQLKQMREARKAKMESVRLQIESVLTPEQKAKLETNKAERLQRREEFKQKRQEMREKRKDSKPADSVS